MSWFATRFSFGTSSLFFSLWFNLIFRKGYIQFNRQAEQTKFGWLQTLIQYLTVDITPNYGIKNYRTLSLSLFALPPPWFVEVTIKVSKKLISSRTKQKNWRQIKAVSFGVGFMCGRLHMWTKKPSRSRGGGRARCRNGVRLEVNWSRSAAGSDVIGRFFFLSPLNVEVGCTKSTFFSSLWNPGGGGHSFSKKVNCQKYHGFSS